MDLILKNKIITPDLISILHRLQVESNYKYLNKIIRKNNYILVSCPFHKDGQEKHPSCGIVSISNDPRLEFGLFNCFTCKTSGRLYTFVGKCLDGDDEAGKQWLLDNYGDTISYEDELLPEIVLESSKRKPKPEFENKVLYSNNISNYLIKRGISEDVIRRFQVGYNPDKQTVTFPVWDENDNLVMITERSVNSKKFYIEENKQKPVYLLNFIKKNNIDSVYVTESQINCLTLHTWGYPAIALFGTGTKNQYEILKKSGIRNYCLALDGDDAGRKGIKRFIDNMPEDVLISIALLPEGKDVNDLTCEEFLNLKFIDKSDFVFT